MGIEREIGRERKTQTDRQNRQTDRQKRRQIQ